MDDCGWKRCSWMLVLVVNMMVTAELSYFMLIGMILCIHIPFINDIELLRTDRQEAGYHMFVIEAKWLLDRDL
jgi:hypothetical protein